MKKFSFFLFHSFYFILFISFFLINSADLHSQCGNTQYTQTQQGSTNFADGPRYLNLYVHLICFDDCTGGLTDAQVGETIEGINTSFNPHSIYFNIACIDKICNTEIFENSCMIETLYPTYSIPNALNIYLIVESNNCPGIDGRAQGTPSKNCWIVWNNSGGPSHELGHCLGLQHTFIGNECVTRDPFDPNYNCETAGDGFCDTQADNQDYRPVINCLWDQSIAENLGIIDNCGVVLQTDPTLLMSYMDVCRHRFSLQQSLYMRNNAYLGTGGPQAPSFQYSSHYISNPTTWTTNKRFNVDVIVASSLTILNATVEMAPGKRIILLDGSALEVNNSTITVGPVANCGSNGNGVMWRGIQIHCSALFNTNVEIKNSSQINKAENGLYLATSNETGARIVISSSSFNDNFRACNLISSGLSKVPLRITQSYIQLTPNYPLSIYSRQLYLGNYPLLSNAIHFKNTKDVNASKAGGLYSYNGWVTINSGSQEGFEKGLEGISLGLNLQMSAKSFLSSKSANHISVNSRRGNQFTGLQITQGDRANLPLSLSNFGLYMYSCQSSNIANNQFTNLNTYSGNRTGFSINWTGSEDQIVGFHNSFSNYFPAAQSGNNNRNVEFLCNYHTANNRDFSWTDIKSTQGTSKKPAGNTFSPSTTSSNRNILSQSPVTYFYGNGINEFPADVDPNVSRVPVNDEGCRFGFANPPDDLAVLEANFLSLSSQRNYLIANNPNNDPVIIDQIHDLDIQIHNVVNQVFNIITSPTDVPLDISLLSLWLQRVNSFESYSQLAYLHLINRDYTQSSSVHASIPTLFTLTPAQQTEYSNNTWLLGFFTTIFQSGRWEGELTQAEVLVLQNFSLNNESSAGIMATNVLEFFYDQANGGGQLAVKDDGSAASAQSYVAKVNENISFYPNPTNGIVNVQCSFINKDDLYEMAVYDLTGHKLYSNQLTNGLNTLRMSELSKGIYFIQFIKNGDIISVQKLFKN